MLVNNKMGLFNKSEYAEIASRLLKVSGYCTCHQMELEKLSEGQWKAIFGQGYKVLFVQQTS
jgi:hypothetical protein